MKADTELDVVGQLCPMPIVKLAKHIRTMNSGQTVEIKADDIGAREDIPAWCNRTGNKYLGMEEDGKIMKFYVQKM